MPPRFISGSLVAWSPASFELQMRVRIRVSSFYNTTLILVHILRAEVKSKQHGERYK